MHEEEPGVWQPWVMRQLTRVGSMYLKGCRVLKIFHPGQLPQVNIFLLLLCCQSTPRFIRRWGSATVGDGALQAGDGDASRRGVLSLVPQRCCPIGGELAHGLLDARHRQVL